MSKKQKIKIQMSRVEMEYNKMSTVQSGNMNITTGSQHPIKEWTVGVPIEDSARRQLFNIASMPFIHRHIAVMPDVHLGKGATVGSVIATNKAIIPAACGVDLGCGMVSIKLSLKASQLPDNLSELRSAIEAAVPHGRTDNGGSNDRGSWGNTPDDVRDAWSNLDEEYKLITSKYPKIFHKRPLNQLGTLGSGNHFYEVCISNSDDVWLMLHTGSRGPGNNIGSFFIEKAKEEMMKYFISLPDQDLAYLPEGSEYFNDYIRAVSWAQNYARINRECMLDQSIKAIRKSKLLPKFEVEESAINCHHNYIAKESHFGENVWVTRKGAVRARTEDLAIIPGSMGAKSFIVRGLGNPESFCSCSHGAGRKMSRSEAKKSFTLKDHRNATKGVECRKDKDVIDETPGAYKDINAVMEAQKDLVEVVHTLKQCLCVKG